LDRGVGVGGIGVPFGGPRAPELTYVAGTNFISNTERKAVIWKNGVPETLVAGGNQWLSAATNCKATSVFVSGKDIYVGGEVLGKYSSNGTTWGPTAGTSAVIWKNGVCSILRDNGRTATVNSVKVSNGNVYAAGLDAGGSIFRAVMWVNGALTVLTDGTKNASANCIFESNGNVYVSGYENNSNNKAVAKLWINGVATDLSNGLTDAYTSCLYVVGNTYYVVGSEYNNAGTRVAKIWTNGVTPELSLTPNSLGSAANSVFYDTVQSKLYVCGTENTAPNTSTARVWANGVRQLFYGTSKLDVANSIFVLGGGTVYLSGYSANNSVIFRSGSSRAVLTGGTVGGSNSIFATY
jgi:hypothetical protein